MAEYRAKYVEHITADWAAQGINHNMAKAPGWEPILSIVSDGYGRLAVVDDAGNKLVDFDSGSTDSIHAAARYMAVYLKAGAE